MLKHLIELVIPMAIFTFQLGILVSVAWAAREVARTWRD
jgi:hypothetical protein